METLTLDHGMDRNGFWQNRWGGGVEPPSEKRSARNYMLSSIPFVSPSLASDEQETRPASPIVRLIPDRKLDGQPTV